MISIGEGRALPDGTVTKLDIKEGDIIAFHPHLAQEIEHDEETIVIINSNAVYGKFK